jgi:dienelactone hydrolase
VETQAADISYLIGHAATLPQADAENVAVVGFSWGGLANAFAAARDARVRALVSLDGSLRSYPSFVDGGKDAARYVTPARVAVPLLYVGARPKTVEQLNRAETSTQYSFINAMKYSDVYVLTMLPMQHANFSSFALRNAQDNQFTTYTRDEVHAAHAWTMRATRHFLDAYLKSDAAGLAFLNASPEANKAPRHTMLAEVRKKSAPTPPTMQALVRQLGADGFDQAIPVYDRLAAQGFKLTNVELYGWGAQLAHLDRPAQAREIFRLGVHLDANDAGMLDGLAEMQAKTGQVAEALASYRRLLELDPSSADAARYVKEHAGSAGAAP